MHSICNQYFDFECRVGWSASKFYKSLLWISSQWLSGTFFCLFNINASHLKCFLLCNSYFDSIIMKRLYNEFPIRILASIFQLNLAWELIRKKSFASVSLRLIWFDSVWFTDITQCNRIVSISIWNVKLIWLLCSVCITTIWLAFVTLS